MKPTVRAVLRLLTDTRALRDCLRWGLNCHGGRVGRDDTTRRDLQHLPVDGATRLEVFWKDLPHGRGPAVSLVIHGEEILRIDCFGKDAGHLHAAFFNPARGEDKLLLPEPSREAQIKRAGFELTRNLGYYQCRVSAARIREHKVDANALADAAARAMALMEQHLEPDRHSLPNARELPR